MRGLRVLETKGVKGLVYYPPIMDNQMEKKMENEMETGVVSGLGLRVY